MLLRFFLITLVFLSFPAAAGIPIPVEEAWQGGIRNDDTVLLETLLGRIKQVDLATPQGKTALMAAASRGATALVEQLLARGARVEAVNTSHGTALLYAALSGEPATLTVLLEAGADLEHRAGNGWTALTLAAAKGHRAAVAQLLAAGADPNVADVYGWTPLMRAIDNGHPQTALTLLETPDLDFTSANRRGQRALHLAVIRGHRTVVRRLLILGADPDAPDHNGLSPWAIAKALARAPF